VMRTSKAQYMDLAELHSSVQHRTYTLIPVHPHTLIFLLVMEVQVA